MLQDNPLLAQLKQQFQSNVPRAEGFIKSHEKGYGFLETEDKKRYFVSAKNMKTMCHGDHVSGLIIQNGDKTAFEPETLIETNLTTFSGQISLNEGSFYIQPEHHQNLTIRCDISQLQEQNLKTGDWVKAELTVHPLKDKKPFSAKAIAFIAESDAIDLLWLMSLAKYDIEYSSLTEDDWKIQDDETQIRLDLTHVDFFTIDSKETQDMDDAISISKMDNGHYRLLVAIADPSAYFSADSETDRTAYQRCFSVYLPGLSIPMLPKSLSNELCSLKANQKRAAVVCQVEISDQGDIIYDSAQFDLAWIISKAKLSYNNVTDFIEYNSDLLSDFVGLQHQLLQLVELARLRTDWRHNNALLFKDNPDYRFVFDRNKKPINIIQEPRLIAHKMVEETMLISNQVFTHKLKNELGFGIFNIHTGLDKKNLDLVIKLLEQHNINEFNKEFISSFDGYKTLRRLIDKHEYLEYRLRRFQAPVVVSSEPSPHFGLGFDAYATWTSPIRKYGDLINHRLLKMLLNQKIADKPDLNILSQMNECRKKIRLVQREINSKLYGLLLTDHIGESFEAQIIDLNRGGMRVRLIDNGAMAFMPSSFIHSNRNEITIEPHNGEVKINQQVSYRLLDSVNVIINEIKTDNAAIIVKMANET